MNIIADQMSHPSSASKTQKNSNFPGILRFRDFTVIPAARVVQQDGEAIKLGARAFDLLVVLLEARGSVVSKKRIFECVWPSLYISDATLRVQVTLLRKALGPAGELLKTVPGRGYLFAVELSEVLQWKTKAFDCSRHD